MLAGFPLSAWLISSFVGIGSASATPPAVAKAAKIEMLPLENIVSLFVGVALRDLHHDLPHRGLVLQDGVCLAENVGPKPFVNHVRRGAKRALVDERCDAIEDPPRRPIRYPKSDFVNINSQANRSARGLRSARSSGPGSSMA